LITRVDEQLRREAERFALRFGCESCAHFEPGARTCANGYPNAAHVDERLGSREALAFCKEFELT
jgi:hypothetical protein